jgi:hypothetical protein
MHKYLIYGTYGWLLLGGTMHLAIDVVSQYVRGKRTPVPETTLYFGMHTAYGLGQTFLGLLGLLVARRALDVLGKWPAMSLCVIAAACWLGFSFIFITEYWEPKFIAAVFGALAIAAAVTA